MPSTVMAEQMRIAMILMGQTYQYWESLREGAQITAEHQGVELLILDPLYENQAISQKGLVQRAMALDVNGLIIAPSNKSSLVDVVGKAKDQGIYTVLVDSGLETQEKFPIVQTDNFAAGKRIGKLIANQLPEDSRIVLLGLPRHVESTWQRINGVESVLADKMTLERYHLDLLSMGDASRGLEEISASLMRADAVFACNESSTLVMLDWFGRYPQSKTKLYGFDMTPKIYQALLEERLQGVMLQDPFSMGKKAVEEVITRYLKARENQPVESFEYISIPSFMVTPEKIKQGELPPELKRYLPI
jgi:ribose transport system substrate-binding protein